jgi:intraflagellar transport protein 74
MGTGKRGAGAKGEVNLTGPGFQEVNMQNRPVTMHGLTGIRADKAGPGRIVYDKSYYMGILRQKNQELLKELDNFHREMDDINASNSTYLTLEKKNEALLKEVRGLEGELADYNLALDKKRADTRTEDLLLMQQHIKLQNERLRANLDEMFLDRKAMEDEISNFEGEIMEINSQAEQRLNELDPEQKQEYFRLQVENKSLDEEINHKRSLLESVNTKLIEVDSKLRTDVLKQKAHHLREQRQTLQRRKEDLEVQLNEQNLSFPEARDRLLARVKEDGQSCKKTEESIGNAKKNIESFKKQIEELKTDMDNTDTSELQKYEVLYEKDKIMSEFIGSFEGTKKAELEMIQTLEDNIVSLLEQTSKILERRDILPSAEQFTDWQEDLQYKNVQTANSVATLEQLKVQLDKRKENLNRIRNFDQRVPKELAALNEKISKMQEEIAKYNNINLMRSEAEAEIIRLRAKREQLQRRKETLSQGLRGLVLKADTKKQQLSDSKVYKELQDLEQKMSMNEQNIFNLMSFIDSKGAETNYQPVRNEVIGLLTHLSGMLGSR